MYNKQNGKVVYEGNNIFLSTHAKSLIEYCDDSARSIAGGEYFQRFVASKDGNEVTCIIPFIFHKSKN